MVGVDGEGTRGALNQKWMGLPPRVGFDAFVEIVDNEDQTMERSKSYYCCCRQR